MPPTKRVPPLLPSLDYLSPQYIALAVLYVYQQNAAHEQVTGCDPANADLWAINEDHRRDIWERTRQQWCELASQPTHLFPYSENYVARLYFRFRKRNADEVKAWHAELRKALHEALTKPKRSRR